MTGPNNPEFSYPPHPALRSRQATSNPQTKSGSGEVTPQQQEARVTRNGAPSLSTSAETSVKATAAARRPDAVAPGSPSLPPFMYGNTAVALGALLAFFLLVLPALLPPLTAPPSVLLLLPVLVMVLLVLAAQSPAKKIPGSFPP